MVRSGLVWSGLVSVFDGDFERADLLDFGLGGEVGEGAEFFGSDLGEVGLLELVDPERLGGYKAHVYISVRASVCVGVHTRVNLIGVHLEIDRGHEERLCVTTYEHNRVFSVRPVRMF